MDNQQLFTTAKAVLDANDRQTHTIPAHILYPHQWLWDSCFIAIGLRNYNVDRAKTEILSLLRGQWSNGMLPHMIFADSDAARRDRNLWRSWLNPYAPDNVATSGITQPPMLAEAVVRIGKKLSVPERRSWYQTVLPALIAHHQWLYNERDPHGEGLTLQVTPWETGLDSTPPWMFEMHEHQIPLWISAIEKLHLDNLAILLRRDTRHVAIGERISTIESLMLYNVQRRLRRKTYNIDKILSHAIFAIEDLAFNSIFIRANQLLGEIAKTAGRKLPNELMTRMKKTEEALDQLWDAYTGQYYSRNFVTHKPLKIPTIATLLPLYSGCISKERAEQLVKLLRKQDMFGAPYPVPSVPLKSEWFEPHRYWQGPTWINTNWLITDGLERYGYHQEAAKIKTASIELFRKSGSYEYFSPIDGTPAGAKDFSWTAALVIDLLTN